MPTNVNIVLPDESYNKLVKLKELFNLKNLAEAIEYSIKAAYEKHKGKMEGPA